MTTSTNHWLPVRVLTRAQLLERPTHDLPGAREGGSLRVVFKGLEAGTFKSTLVVVPTGQASPPRQSEIEHIVLVLDGSFTFAVGDDEYRLDAMDQIFVPVGPQWGYRNAALQQSSFLSITGP